MSENRARPGNDDAAYAAFVARVWDRQLRVARLLTGDRYRAEELLQDCLVRLYQKWRRVARRGDPQAYLRRMLVNGNVSRWRRARRETLVADSPDRPDPAAVPPEPHAQLRAALQALSRQQRAVVVLRHYLDLSEQDTAASLGCSLGTVKTHHWRAMERLRALLPDTSEQGVRR